MHTVMHNITPKKIHTLIPDRLKTATPNARREETSDQITKNNNPGSYGFKIRQKTVEKKRKKTTFVAAPAHSKERRRRENPFCSKPSPTSSHTDSTRLQTTDSTEKETKQKKRTS
jgi:hypothetical protein